MVPYKFKRNLGYQKLTNVNNTLGLETFKSTFVKNFKNVNMKKLNVCFYLKGDKKNQSGETGSVASAKIKHQVLN